MITPQTYPETELIESDSDFQVQKAYPGAYLANIRPYLADLRCYHLYFFGDLF